MKKCILVIATLLICTLARAECTGEILSVTQDQEFGSVVIETKYVLNGVEVQIGKTRYDENSGTAEEIKAKIQADIDEHCGNLVMRILENREFINSKILEINLEKTQQIADLLQTEVGKKSKNVFSKTVDYKGKRIEVKDDKTVSVTDLP